MRGVGPGTFQLETLVRPSVLRLEPYSSAREESVEGVLLDANENPFANRAGEVELNRYPDPQQRVFRERLSGWLGVSPQETLAGSGSDEILDWLFKVFCRPGQDRVAIASPTYGMYRVLADLYDIEVCDFPLNEKFGLDAAEFLRRVPAEVKLLFVCSPNNPTGNLLDRRQILEICRAWNGIVVADEAYIEFSSGASLVGEHRAFPNLVIVRTFSKAWGRAGLRLGYTVATAPLIELFYKVKNPYNLGSWTLQEGLSALGQVEVMQRQVAILLAERTRLERELAGFDAVSQVFPSAANFILFRCRNASRICRGLAEQGIVIRNRSRVPGLEGCLRVSVGTAEENDRFLESIAKVFKGEGL